MNYPDNDTKFPRLIGERYCRLKREYIPFFVETFQEQYETIHRLETNKLRNVACCYAHMLYTDALPWTVFSIIRLTENDTTSSRYLLKQQTSSATKALYCFGIVFVLASRLGGVVASLSLPALRVPDSIPPDASRPVTKLRIGTASVGDTHSLARRANPPTASIVPR